MSVANNQRFKAGPQCLYTMPLIVSDLETADFVAADGTAHDTGKTAGEGHEALANVGTAAAARAGVLRYQGAQGRLTPADPTAFFDIEDGRGYAGYSTYGIHQSGTKHAKVEGQANVFSVKVTKAPVLGTRVVPNVGREGNSTVTDYAGGAQIGHELLADRWIRGYYLPWRSNHATTMRLGNRANFFLTSTLTGCTFHVYGSRSEPTVTHANNGAQPDLGLSQRYMRSLLDQIMNDEQHAPNQGEAKLNEATWRTHDYKLKATPYLDAKVDKGYAIDQAFARTLVAGYRDPVADEWSFFAQQLVVVGYRRTGAKGFFGKREKKRIFIKQALQIWPAGGGPIQANLWP